MRDFIITFLFLGIFYFSYGQIYVQYDKPASIETIENAHIEAWQKVKYSNGYRIQLIAVSSKSSAQRILSEFETLYPETNSYLSYLEPNFKVRVGDFRTKIDAYRFLMQIKSVYPGAFIIKEHISFRDL